MKYRVKVYSGDVGDFLGYGYLIGWVTVYFVVDNEGTVLMSDVNAEERPDYLIESGEAQEIIEVKENPKLLLDDGRIFYGCQVWWEIDKTTKESKQ